MHCLEWTPHVSVHANLKVPIFVDVNLFMYHGMIEWSVSLFIPKTHKCEPTGNGRSMHVEYILCWRTSPGKHEMTFVPPWTEMISVMIKYNSRGASRVFSFIIRMICIDTIIKHSLRSFSRTKRLSFHF